MNDNRQNPLTEEIYHWVASMKCAQVGKSPNHIHFSSGTRKGTISFYDGYIIELSVEDETADQVLFYIHFAIQDAEKTKENIRLFFRFLEGKKQQKEQLDLPAIQRVRPLKILICCSCGLTSSYFAYLMQETINQTASHIKADAVSYTNVEQVHVQYDYILLAPQIAYMLTDFQKKYGNKVLNIDIIDFASRNVNHVLNLILQKAGMAA